MRIGVLSDTHIPDIADKLPEKMLEDFKTVDMVIHAGDITDLGVLDEIKKFCGNIKAVRGNMDSYATRAKLQEKEIIKLGNFIIGVMHGRGHPNGLIELMKRAFKDDRSQLVIFGHSHSPLELKEEGVIYFNPGSPTDTLFAPYKSYGIIEIDKDNKIKTQIIKI